jgi:hypothetical protein
MRASREFVKKHYKNAFVHDHMSGKYIDTGFITFPVCSTTEKAWNVARDLVLEDLKDQAEKYPEKSLADIRFQKVKHIKNHEIYSGL